VAIQILSTQIPVSFLSAFSQVLSRSTAALWNWNINTCRAFHRASVGWGREGVLHSIGKAFLF